MQSECDFIKVARMGVLMVILIVFAIIGVFGGVPRTHAQTAATAGASGGGQPPFLMTWQALDSYAPAGYAGQILPNQESEIAASLEVIGANGKPVNLSGQ